MTQRMTRRFGIGLMLMLLVPVVAMSAEIPLVNWSPPARAMADQGNLGLFQAVTPCRVVDTRNAAGPYGGPILTGFVTRNFDIDSGPCTGIPAGSAGYSLNITVTGSAAGGAGFFVTVWPTGLTQPLVSTLNFSGGETIANAAVVPAGTGGSISVFPNNTTHIIIDINGYFTGSGQSTNAGNSFDLRGNINERFLATYNDSTGASLFNNAIYGYSPGGAQSAAVQGRHQGTGPGSGVHGFVLTATDQNAGVLGDAGATTGRVYGVRGETSSGSIGAAGVLGVGDGGYYNAPGWFGDGVLGLGGNGVSSVGVEGFSTFRGVQGSHGVITTGNLAPDGAGVLGFSTTSGVHAYGDVTATGTKSFVQPHPTEAGKIIKYVALEGPEAGTYFRGRAKFAGGMATISVPDHFRLTTLEDGLSVQITPIGDFAQFAVVSLNLNTIVIKADRDVEFFYYVNGVRSGAGKLQVVQEDRDHYFVPLNANTRLESVWGEENRAALVANGTFNADGSVNMQTAEKLGWTKEWAEQQAARDRLAKEAQARAAAEAAIAGPPSSLAPQRQ